MKSTIFLLIFLKTVSSQKYNNDDYCSTAACVHSAASILDKLDDEIDPCEDFYAYSCGRFGDELGVPDEKITTDTLTIIKDRVQEYIYTLVDEPIDENEPKNHRISKKFYSGCLNSGNSNGDSLWRFKTLIYS